ncbi:MAG TPA: TRAP transporter small permease subunit, partial [Alphaproteobacteria bacterium]|nr:TRAP transporter small permease subunit [Alphaproteobacteria bacterium]
MTAANPSAPASFLRLECALDPAMRMLAGVVAALGGVVLLIVMAITCVSVTGRALLFLGLGAVPGDFELVELGSAFVVFCFMPWCQYRRGHVTVDLFVAATGPRVLAALAV